MSKLKSALLTTLYHGFALVAIWLMLMMAYIGANTVLPESLYTSNEPLAKLSYSFATALVSIVGFIVMIYPIANWATDIYSICTEELHSVVRWIYNIAKTFVSGGVNAISEQNKDTL